MLEFRTIDRSDKDRITEILRQSDFRGCEYSFANNLAWYRVYKTSVCFYGGFYITKSESDGLRFTYPPGQGDIRQLFSELKRYSEERGFPLTISSVTDEKLQMLSEMYPDGFSVSDDEGGFDYIYNAGDLKSLSGGKYHKKRNHLKKIENYNYSYSPMTEADFDDCITFAANHYNARGSADESEIGEQFAINTFFGEFDYLGLSGGVLRVDGRVAAFTIGERLNSDTQDIHIEKADTSVDGAYPAINNFYARSLPDDVKYINREEDMGIEGLRKSKMSYHPAFLLKKHILTFK
ncbi:MAG: DUF2156 domain-containing protein [Oscillospiraceae bacterium]